MSKSPVRIVGFGAGGHARVVLDALLSARDPHEVALLDPGYANSSVMGVRVVGGDEELPRLVAAGATSFFVGVGGLPGGTVRRRLFQKGEGYGLEPLAIAHPTAAVSRYAEVGAGSVVLALAAVNASARVGRNAVVNTGAIVEHDCELGDHCHVAPGAALSGGVTVGEGAHVGTGASIRQGVTIGARATVGAGAVVIRDVPEDAVVAGVPARPLGSHDP